MALGGIPFHKHVIVCAAAIVIVTILINVSGSIDQSLKSPCNAERSTKPSIRITIPSRAAEPSIPAMFFLHNILPDPAQTSGTTSTASTLPSTKTGKIERSTSSVISQTTYQQLYPDLYCTKTDVCIVHNKTVYLTFDDGPSQQTPKILDILKKNGITATFFVVGKTDKYSRSMMKQIVEDGHTLGLHSYSHNYKRVYQSVDAFLNDYNALNTLVFDATGTRPNIYRFPGGSINDYDKNIYPLIITEMKRRGYTYFDWNVSSADTNANATADSIYKNIVRPVEKNSRSIVLMHDAKPAVVNALDCIIKELKRQGYTFSPLTNEIKPIVF